LIRDAIKKLEFYGLLKTLPQSGTVVSALGVSAIDGMITDVLRLDQPDFRSLVETRIILESNAVGLAALRRSTRHLAQLEEAFEAYAAKASVGISALEEDLTFHLRIAEASGNSVINTLMLIIAPEIINNFEKFHVCDKKQTMQGVLEHRAIFDAIAQKDMNLARAKLNAHFGNLYQYCYNDYEINDFSKLITDAK
jgi:GntR family transcriptional repressor for pyruvate dehydrogenase complex